MSAIFGTVRTRLTHKPKQQQDNSTNILPSQTEIDQQTVSNNNDSTPQPSRQVVVQEDTLDRDEAASVDKETNAAATSVNNPIVDNRPVSLQERVRYVHRCLEDVKAGLRPVATVTDAAPKDELAYAIHAVTAKTNNGSSNNKKATTSTTTTTRTHQTESDADRLLIESELRREKENNAQQSVASAASSEDDQEIILEDVVTQPNHNHTRSSVTNQSSTEEAQLVDFEQRLEYVYRCLKQIQDKKLQDIREERAHAKMYGSQLSKYHFSERDDEAAYELALQQTKKAIATVTDPQLRAKL